MREAHRGLNRLIEDTHVVVLLKGRDQPRIMITACASVGSSTLTTWKRRASAASFSKYFLYSDQVVAATCAARRGPAPA